MRVSFAIQAHPRRAEMAEALAARIGGQVDVVYDPRPTGSVRSAWRTFRHVFETAPPGATHRAQIQDDAVVCDGYRQAVEAAVAARPDRLLVFAVLGNPHAHAQAVMAACHRDEPWALLNYGMWCPVIATCWPIGLAREMIAWNDETWPDDRYERFTSDDERVGRFLEAIRMRPLASVPSLADHPDMEESLIGRKTRYGQDPGRVAVCFIGEGCGDCASRIDWTAGPGDGDGRDLGHSAPRVTGNRLVIPRNRPDRRKGTITGR